MRKLTPFYLLCFLFISACQISPKDPAKDLPNYALQWERFDSAFFAMDTLDLSASVNELVKQYPHFAPDFFSKILMLNSTKDTGFIKDFYKSYLPIFQQASKLQIVPKELESLQAAFKRIHYYFPKYPLTHRLISFIGPLESYGNIVTTDALALGLQMYLGAHSEWYFSERMQTIYPTYLSRRFAPAYLVVNSVQNILNDIVPVTRTNGTLLEEMIEAGKRQYVINACLPNVADTVRFGFTQLQLNALKQEEPHIWSYILRTKLLYSVQPTDIRSLMQEGVYSDLFGEEIPGNAGKYIGYKIVENWMQQKAPKALTMESLLTMPANTIFTEARYQP
jgi:hypothetical protein